MKYIFLSLLLFFISCGYPDLDTVPKFDELLISKEEYIDLCHLSNTDNNEILKCIDSINLKDSE